MLVNVLRTFPASWVTVGWFCVDQESFFPMERTGERCDASLSATCGTSGWAREEVKRKS